MKTTKLLILTMVISLNTVFAQENIENDSSFPLLEGPYLGQKPPGSIPEVFAPGIVSTDRWEMGGVFTPDMKEFYFVKGDTNFVSQYKNNRWSEPVVSHKGYRSFISPDGKMLYSANKYRERTHSGWSEIKSLGSPFKDIPIMRLSVSSNGTYYFDTRTKDGSGTIRYSRLIGGKREKPRVLGKEINTGNWKAHPFIAPDESYLIWDAEREEGYGDNDFYISFRQKDGSWGTAINMGDKINTALEELYGSVTPDGKYLFFERVISPNNVDIYWVDAQIIETLRPKY